jgi:hypothetical protein
MRARLNPKGCQLLPSEAFPESVKAVAWLYAKTESLPRTFLPATRFAKAEVPLNERPVPKRRELPATAKRMSGPLLLVQTLK